jgi:predicted phosphodiesterase
LSRIAPVIAVHGNDETAEAQAALPYLQTLVVEGQRIVLTHAHYPDRAAEIASRTDEWQPKIQRRLDFARQQGAGIIVYGHLHIPMCLQREGVLLINPGAIASGNYWSRQLIQTLAILEIVAGRAPQVTHYDLASGQPHQCIFDAAGFYPTFALPITAGRSWKRIWRPNANGCGCSFGRWPRNRSSR